MITGLAFKCASPGKDVDSLDHAMHSAASDLEHPDFDNEAEDGYVFSEAEGEHMDMDGLAGSAKGGDIHGAYECLHLGAQISAA